MACPILLGGHKKKKEEEDRNQAPILQFSIGLAGRPYNSVSTIPCDAVTREYYQSAVQSEN